MFSQTFIFNYCVYATLTTHEALLHTVTLSENCPLRMRKSKLRELNVLPKVVWLASGRMRYSFYGKKGCSIECESRMECIA